MQGRQDIAVVILENGAARGLADRVESPGIFQKFGHGVGKAVRIPKITEKSVFSIAYQFSYRLRIRSHNKTTAA